MKLTPRFELWAPTLVYQPRTGSIHERVLLSGLMNWRPYISPFCTGYPFDQASDAWSLTLEDTPR